MQPGFRPKCSFEKAFTYSHFEKNSCL
ncbi:UNVERIFIED_CONTAM: hypothetical protein NCL1_61089 [Trichonephila clavipes]